MEGSSERSGGGGYFSVTPALMRATAQLAEREDVRLHTHLGETEDENRYCEEIYHCRPLDYLEESGWLGPRTWLAHGIHFDAGEIARMAKAKTTICHCASSNQVLASGGCPVCDMEEADFDGILLERWVEGRIALLGGGASSHERGEANGGDPFHGCPSQPGVHRRFIF